MKDLLDTLNMLARVLLIGAAVFTLIGVVTRAGHSDQTFQNRYMYEGD